MIKTFLVWSWTRPIGIRSVRHIYIVLRHKLTINFCQYTYFLHHLHSILLGIQVETKRRYLTGQFGGVRKRLFSIEPPPPFFDVQTLNAKRRQKLRGDPPPPLRGPLLKRLLTAHFFGFGPIAATFLDRFPSDQVCWKGNSPGVRKSDEPNQRYWDFSSRSNLMKKMRILGLPLWCVIVTNELMFNHSFIGNKEAFKLTPITPFYAMQTRLNIEAQIPLVHLIYPRPSSACHRRRYQCLKKEHSNYTYYVLCQSVSACIYVYCGQTTIR